MSKNYCPSLVESDINRSDSYKNQYSNCLHNQILYIKSLLNSSISIDKDNIQFHSFEIYLIFLLSEIYLKQSYLRIPHVFSSFSEISSFFRKKYKHRLYCLLVDCNIDSVIENKRRTFFKYLKNQIEINNYVNNINQYTDFRYGTSMGGASKYNAIRIDMGELYEYIREI